MTRDSIMDELLDKLAAATKTTMVGDHAVPIMVAEKLLHDAFTRGTNHGYIQALDIVGSRRLELACMLAGHLAQGPMRGASPELTCKEALAILDTMVNCISNEKEKTP
jgi:hypothetical protein